MRGLSFDAAAMTASACSVVVITSNTFLSGCQSSRIDLLGAPCCFRFSLQSLYDARLSSGVSIIQNEVIVTFRGCRGGILCSVKRFGAGG